MNQEWKTVSWKCPSNIALIKYWGKYGHQLPLNPSLSLTLKNAYTQTTVEYKAKKTEKASVEFIQMHNDHQDRMTRFINNQKESFPNIFDYDLRIKTFNSFPDQAGIASSASGLGALALCLCEISNGFNSSDQFYRQVSDVARQGSGSASRSIYGNYVVWGEHDQFPSYSNEFALKVDVNVHPHFQNMQNAILIVDSAKKSLSSSAGHRLMENHNYRRPRLENAKRKISELHKILESGDWRLFSDLVIAEAWELHALMMLSQPPFTLLRPKTLEAIEKIEEFRKKENINCAWTLDAGPNIHFLFQESDKNRIQQFIALKIEPLTETVLYDQQGDGPERIEHV
jgi:diphosphomevalonate decarboxylase